MTREDRFVERLKGMLPASERVSTGPGDDAAVVRMQSGDLVVTTDMVVEGVDFLPETEPEAIGRRALAVNLSDLAAMGARPEFFLLSLGFDAKRGEDFPLAVARGALSRARPLGLDLVGGDLSNCPRTVVSIALWGRAETPPALRSGARAGDLLLVTGFPGRAAAGLSLASRFAAGPGSAGLPAEVASELLAAYRDPEPRVALGLELSRRRLWNAAIDVSDGIGVDAGRLARASGLRAVIEKERLPVSPALETLAALREKDPFDWILGGGDDYELLFAAPEVALDAIGRLASREVPITRIGRLEKGEGAVLRDRGAESDIASRGHDHFERRP